jgi:hypothetical protein
MLLLLLLRGATSRPLPGATAPSATAAAKASDHSRCLVSDDCLLDSSDITYSELE